MSNDDLANWQQPWRPKTPQPTVKSCMVEIKRLESINADLLAACKQALYDHQGRDAPTHLIAAIAKATVEANQVE